MFSFLRKPWLIQSLNMKLYRILFVNKKSWIFYWADLELFPTSTDTVVIISSFKSLPNIISFKLPFQVIFKYSPLHQLNSISLFCSIFFVRPIRMQSKEKEKHAMSVLQLPLSCQPHYYRVCKHLFSQTLLQLDQVPVTQFCSQRARVLRVPGKGI